MALREGLEERIVETIKKKTHYELLQTTLDVLIVLERMTREADLPCHHTQESIDRHHPRPITDPVEAYNQATLSQRAIYKQKLQKILDSI